MCSAIHTAGTPAASARSVRSTMSGRDTIPSSAIDLIEWGGRAPPTPRMLGAPQPSRGAPRPRDSPSSATGEVLVREDLRHVDRRFHQLHVDQRPLHRLPARLVRISKAVLLRVVALGETADRRELELRVHGIDVRVGLEENIEGLLRALLAVCPT